MIFPGVQALDFVETVIVVVVVVVNRLPIIVIEVVEQQLNAVIVLNSAELLKEIAVPVNERVTELQEIVEELIGKKKYLIAAVDWVIVALGLPVVLDSPVVS
jgi:hypothetical protein